MRCVPRNVPEITASYPVRRISSRTISETRQNPVFERKSLMIARARATHRTCSPGNSFSPSAERTLVANCVSSNDVSFHPSRRIESSDRPIHGDRRKPISEIVSNGRVSTLRKRSVSITSGRVNKPVPRPPIR